MSFDKAKKKLSSWRLEQSFDEVSTLEDLIRATPFTDASDASGATNHISTRIPTWIYRQIAYITEMKATPYRVHSDTIRDALYVGLRILSMRYKTSPEWAVEASMARAVDKVGTTKRVRSRINELSSGLEEMLNSRDELQAVKGLEEFLLPVLELEDSWYKGKIIELIMDNRIASHVLTKCSEPLQKAVAKVYKGDRV